MADEFSIPTTVLTNMARADILAEIAAQNPEAVARAVEGAAARYRARMPTTPEAATAIFGAVLEPLIDQLVKVQGVRIVGGEWLAAQGPCPECGVQGSHSSSCVIPRMMLVDSMTETQARAHYLRRRRRTGFGA